MLRDTEAICLFGTRGVCGQCAHGLIHARRRMPRLDYPLFHNHVNSRHVYN
jgi:hypothetical protein